MADEDLIDDDETSSSSGGLLGALSSLNTTTPEAKDYARRILDKSDDDSGEQSLLDEMRKKADANKEALQAARTKLLARRMPTSTAWLKAASALSRPTKFGTLAETMGNVAGELAPYGEARAKFNEDKDKQLLGLDQSLAGVNDEVTLNQMRLQILKRQADARMRAEALKVMSRGVGKSGTSGQLSVFGKQARDEGNPVDTPQWNQRVRQLQDQATKIKQVTAGMDEAPLSPEEKTQTALQAGVPIPKFDPYAGMSTKRKQQAQAIDQREAEMELKGMGDEIAAARQGISQAGRFATLNLENPTGPFLGRVPALSTADQEMEAISSELSRKMRQKGEGSTSDFDAKQFQKATFGRTKNASANLNLIKAFKAKEQNTVDRGSFLQTYYSLHGHLKGAQDAWNDYIQDNPIFDPSVPGAYKLNPERVDYKTYFRSKLGQPDVQHKAEGGKVAKLLHFVVDSKTGQKMSSGYQNKMRASHRADQLDNNYGAYRYVVKSEPAPEGIELLSTTRDEDDVPSFNSDPIKKATGGVIRSAVQGATMGAGDELESAIEPGDYDENLKKNRESIGQSTSENPILSVGMQAAGSGLLFKGLQVAKSMGLSQAAIRLIPKSEIIRLALMGGLFGAGQGVMSGEDAGDRMKSGAEGLFLGSAVGPLAGLATKYGLIGAGNMISGSRLSKDPTTPGDRRVMEALERDSGIDPAQRMSEAKRLKVPTSMGTSGGEHLQALGKASIREGGDEADQMATRAEERMSGSRGRVEERINQSLKPDEYFNKMDELTSDLYKNAKPLYEAAYSAHPSIRSKNLLDILETDAGEKAVREAMQFFNNIPGKKIGPADAMKMVKNPSLEFFDKVKQGFDQLISKEESQGPTPLGKTMRALRGNLVSELDDQAPEYKLARSQYKGDLEVRDALRAGREDFHSFTPEEIRRSMKDMSFAERDAFRSGIAQGVFEDINRPTGDYNAAKKIITSPSTAEKFEALFEKPSEAKIFRAALEREVEEFEKTKGLASAAGPARLARASNDPSVINRVGSTLDAIPNGNIFSSAMKTLKLMPNMSEKTADQIAQILREEDPKVAADYLKRLGVKSAAMLRRNKRAGKVGMAVAAITGALTAPPPHESNSEEEITP